MPSFRLATVRAMTTFREHCVSYQVEGLQLLVLDLETVIASKTFANREKDRATLPILRRALALKREQDKS